MESGGSVEGFECRSCGSSFEPEPVTGRCPDCGGILRARLSDHTSPSNTFDRPAHSMWDFGGLLPGSDVGAVTMGEGGTPLVPSAKLADEFGIDHLWIKDEGQNPTGSVTDRELGLAVTAISDRGAKAASLATPGAAGQSFAAYAARAGLEGVLYLPSRAPFERKAMSNVHGVDLTVVQGRLPEAEADLARARADSPLGHPIGAFETPFRYLGATTVAFEIVAQLAVPPDVIVVPTGSGVTTVGIYEGLKHLEALGELRKFPRLVGVQPSGCSPIAAAHKTGEPIRPVAVPDTVCGELEWPDPAGGAWVLEAIDRTNGTMVSISDDSVLEMGLRVASETGLELRPDAAAAPAAVEELSEEGHIGPGDSVVAVSTGTGGADLLRSHLGAHPR